MKTYKDIGFEERIARSAAAKQKALDRLRARPASGAADKPASKGDK
jgi:hypothetical protein